MLPRLAAILLLIYAASVSGQNDALVQGGKGVTLAKPFAPSPEAEGPSGEVASAPKATPTPRSMPAPKVALAPKVTPAPKTPLPKVTAAPKATVAPKITLAPKIAAKTTPAPKSSSAPAVFIPKTPKTTLAPKAPAAGAAKATPTPKAAPKVVPPAKAAVAPPPKVTRTPAAGAASGFIRVSGTQFVDDMCMSFVPRGFNGWHLIEQVTKSLSPPDPGVVPAGETILEYTFRTSKEAGYNAVRFFALGDNDDDRNSPTLKNYALQPAPGQYNETIFRAIDQILATAAKHDMKVMLVLTSNWQQIDGVPQYLEWCANIPVPKSTKAPAGNYSAFFTEPKCRQLYMNHAAKVLNRVNTVSNIAYKNDPNIFAIDLYNEPRCQDVPKCNGAVSSWTAAMAKFVRSFDKNHMITLGEEGFFNQQSPYKSSNPLFPKQDWPSKTGQDFVADHSSPDISFAGVHLWPDRWQETSPGFAKKWLDAHQEAARQLKKPLLLEEFGKLKPRDDFFTAILEYTIGSVREKSPLQGVLYWLFQSASDGSDKRPDGSIDRVEYGIVPKDTTWPLIINNFKTLAAIPSGKVAGCITVRK